MTEKGGPLSKAKRMWGRRAERKDESRAARRQDDKVEEGKVKRRRRT